MDAVALGFRFFQAAGVNDAAACIVCLQRSGYGCRFAQAHDSLQHLDHVIDSVVLVVQNDEVVDLFVFRR